MIVGLTGQKQSGKDTIAAYLVKEHKFERKAFADPLKKSVAALFDIPFSEVDKLKLNPNAVAAILDYTEDSIASQHDMTFRTLLQRYGTEAHRDIFGTNFWVDQTLPVDGFYPGRAICVTDVRFSNEASRVRELGGVVVRVFRGEEDLSDLHASEIIDFDWDYAIHNDGTLGDLYINIEEMLSTVVARYDN